jgi:predicted PP-loop superfamily ATPase
MDAKDVTPTTIEGIKRLAKSIKKQYGCPHHEALDIAAQRAGYMNLRHAQRLLRETSEG